MKKIALMFVMIVGTFRGVFGMDPRMMTLIPIEMQMKFVSDIIDLIREEQSVSLFNFQNDEQKLEALYQEVISDVKKNQMATTGFEIPKTFAEAQTLVKLEMKKLVESDLQLQDANITETEIDSYIDVSKKTILLAYDAIRPSYFSMHQSYAIVTTAAALAVLAAYKYVYPSKKSASNNEVN